MSQKHAKVHQSHEDITMVLLGTNSKDKCMIGNTILQENCFDVENEAQARRKKGDDQLIFVINTPDKFHWLTPQYKDNRKELNPSYPGPRVFLLVLQGDKLTQKESDLLHQLKVRFGETMVEKTIIVLVSDREESFKELYERADEKLKQLLETCRKRVCVHKKNKDMKDPELIKQLKKIWDQMQKRDQESISTATGDDNMNETIEKTKLMKHTDENKAEDAKGHQSCKDIIMVLLGINSEDKCMIGNAIVQEDGFGVENEAWARLKKGDDQLIFVINTPDEIHWLTPQSKDTREELNPSYPGPRVFLLILRGDKLSQIESDLLHQLKARFGETMVENTIIVLVSDREESFKELYERADEKLKKLVHECRRRVCVHKKNKDMKDPELIKQLKKIWDQMQKRDQESISTATGDYNMNETIEKTKLMKHTDENKGKNDWPSAGENITMLLLGKNNDDKCLIGNIILGAKQFKSKDCERNKGKVADKSVVVIKTPDSLHSDPAAHSMEEMNPSYTGPRIFLLVVQENEASQEETTQLKKRFGEKMVGNTIVVLVSDREESFQEIYERDENLKKLLNEFEKRVFVHKKTRGMKDPQLTKHIMKIWDQMQKQDHESTNSAYGGDNMYENVDNTLPMKQTEENKVYQEPAAMTVMDSRFMTIVLLGQTGSGKSATGNTILGQQQFESHASSVPMTKSCSIKEGTVCHMKIKVIDTPDFFNEDLKNQDEQLRSCKELIQHRPVVFLLVMHLGRFTDGEREVLPRLKKEFGEDITSKTVILFTGKEKLHNKTLADYINGSDQELQHLVRTCGSRCVAFDNNKKNHQQVKELIETIVKMQTDGNIPGMMPHRPSKKQIPIPKKIKDNKGCRIL